MAQEIERKFLVTDDAYTTLAQPEPYRQAYISLGGSCIVRVRVAAGKGYLTIKGKTVGISRDEYEYTIPAEDAEAMILNLAIGSAIDKQRYTIPYKNHVWEVDVFHGANEGLVVAEIELQSEDEAFEKPLWVGQEVTDFARYRNSSLVSYPFEQWGHEEKL